MEYHQITLIEYQEMKQAIELELNNIAEGFIRVGYHLKRMRDSEGFRQGGYETLAEFAQTEYHLDQSTVSRLIKINDSYSIDGYSKLMKPEYKGYGSSKLSEMLQIPIEEHELLSQELTREDIREYKKFKKEEKKAEKEDKAEKEEKEEKEETEATEEKAETEDKTETEETEQSKEPERGEENDAGKESIQPTDKLENSTEASESKAHSEELPEPTNKPENSLEAVIEEMFHQDKEALNELFASEAYRTGNLEDMVEILNPNGSRTFRKGIYFLFFYDLKEGIKYRKFGENQNYQMTWEEFLTKVQEIFGEAAAGKRTWEKFFQKESREELIEKPANKQENPIAPAHKSPEKIPVTKPVEEPEQEKSWREKAKEGECPKDTQSCIRQEWGTNQEQQEAGTKECEACWKKYGKTENILQEAKKAEQQEKESRYAHLKRLSIPELAEYLHRELKPSIMLTRENVEEWLQEAVEI